MKSKKSKGKTKRTLVWCTDSNGEASGKYIWFSKNSTLAKPGAGVLRINLPPKRLAYRMEQREANRKNQAQKKKARCPRCNRLLFVEAYVEAWMGSERIPKSSFNDEEYVGREITFRIPPHKKWVKKSK